MIGRHRNNFFLPHSIKLQFFQANSCILCSSISGTLPLVCAEADETGEILDLSSNLLIKEQMQKSLQYLMSKLLRMYAKAWHGDHSWVMEMFVFKGMRRVAHKNSKWNCKLYFSNYILLSPNAERRDKLVQRISDYFNLKQGPCFPWTHFVSKQHHKI